MDDMKPFMKPAQFTTDRSAPLQMRSALITNAPALKAPCPPRPAHGEGR